MTLNNQDGSTSFRSFTALYSQLLPLHSAAAYSGRSLRIRRRKSKLRLVAAIGVLCILIHLFRPSNTKDSTQGFLVSSFGGLNGKFTNWASDENEYPKVLMTTFLFGHVAATKKYLRLFVESAQHSGADLLIVGDNVPPFPLPPNVKHVLLSWEELVDTLQARVFPSNPSCCDHLRKSTFYYKVNDFKPLFASLFPELVIGYDWWGHVDNDMVLGDLNRFFTRDLLQRHDVITAYTHTYTAGPFTLFRNTPVINELYRRAKRPLEDIFANPRNLCFDEWGCGRKDPVYYDSTMAGIVEKSISELGIRWIGLGVYYWDGYCAGRKSFLPCGECLYHRSSEGAQQLLLTYTGPHQLQSEVAFCHFQWTKGMMDASLGEDDRLSENMIAQGAYRINFRDGFSLLNSETPAKYLNP
jgi:hypothetical protein